MAKNLKIEKIVHNGYGLARDEQKTYFIPYTIENEDVNIQIVDEKKNYTYALPERINSPSKYRIEPKCRYFRICGGCDFQHIDYAHQATIKEIIINEFLQKNNILINSPLKFVPSSQPFNYRSNARFRVLDNKPGFAKKHSHEIVLIEECPLLDENIMNFVKSVKDFHSINSVTIKIDNNKNISSNIKKNRLMFSIDDLNIYYDFRIFFQANKFLIKSWLTEIADFVSSFNKKRIIELYCGAGIISLFLAKKFDIKKITGIDKDNTAINFARINREKNKLFNVKFISGKVEKAIDNFDSANIIIVNPPRRGVPSEVLNKVVGLHPEAIIYSSCEISTFIRDAKIITSQGYSLEKISAIDMFPQTYHFEVIGLFIL